LSLIIPTNGIASLTIDGVKGGFDDEYQHPNYPGYSVVVKRWPAAQAQCIVQSDSGFTAITYGMGGAESYGYNAGTYINNLNGYPGIKNQYSATSADNLYTCAETPVQLTVLMRYQPTILNWQLSKLAGTIAPAVDVVQNNPVPVGSQILNGMVYYRYSLQGYYRFSKPGMHAVPLLATSPIVENCNQTEEVLYVVEVKPAANTGFSIDFRNCSMSENVQFSGRDTFDNGSIIYKWNWVFDATQNAEGKSVSQVFTPGAHSVLLIAADSAGCIADSTASFVLNGKPNTPDFRVTSPDSCAGTTFIFEEMNTDASVTQWYWDFGNNDTLTVFDNKPISRRFLTPGTITVKHVVKNGQACVSDTASLVLVIHAMSTASFNMPASVCMPGGAVAFINTSTVAAGVHLNYAWQFGDGSPVSADEDPVHVYRQPGNYTVTLTAFTDKGCASEVSQVFNKFFEKPVASFSLPSYSLCQGMTARFVDESYAPGGTVNAWSWNFGDGSTSTQQEPTRQYNTPGTFQVKLVVGSSQGCVSDTFSRQLQVYPQPLVDAGPSFVVKEGANVQFQATVNAPDFVIRWSPSTGLDNPNIISPTLLNADNDEVYTVTATGQNNCSASDGLTVKVQKGVFIPNAFSPNNDGINDVWKIKNIELYPGATIEIYDRYGSVVYRSTGGSQPWNGSVKGKQAPSGTYYYIIDLKDGSSWRNGSVTLLR
jgi:gliding motility-associated-like protein